MIKIKQTKHFQCSKIFKNRKIDELAEEIKSIKTIANNTKDICEHESEYGKTIIIILSSGMIEIHELLRKNCIYTCATIRNNKKEFEKIKKELELLND